MSYRLINSSGTALTPSLCLLPKLDIVQLEFVSPTGENQECMWVRVIQARRNGTFLGLLDNEPTLINARLFDPVVFSSEHVLQVLRIH